MAGGRRWLAQQEELDIQDDLFAIVGVAPNAQPAEIKRAFKEQARRLHPDSNPDDPESAKEFRRLVAAFETLSDPQRRHKWEQMRSMKAPFFGGSRRPSRNPPNGNVAPTRPTRAAPAADQSIVVPGGSLRTWSYTSPSVEKVQLSVETEGNAYDANVELWCGPDSTPCKLQLHTDNGKECPFSAVVIMPPGPTKTIAIRNNGMVEFPLSAKLDGNAATVESPAAECISAIESLEGGANRLYHFDPTVESVQIVLKTADPTIQPLDARIELLQGGPDKSVQAIDVRSEVDGQWPFFCIVATPGSGDAVRVVNNAPAGSPISASVVPNPNKLKKREAAASQVESPPNVGQQAGGASNAGHPAAHADQAATRDGDQITDAAKGVDLSAMEGGQTGVGGPGAAELKAQVDSIAEQVREEVDRMAASATTDADTTRAEAKQLDVELQEAKAAADAIRAEMDGQLQEAETARQEAINVGKQAPARDAAQRAQRRIEQEMRRETEGLLKVFIAKATAGREAVVGLKRELEAVSIEVDIAKADAQYKEGELSANEQAQVSRIVDDGKAKIAARLAAAERARQAVAAAEQDQRAADERSNGDASGDADARAQERQSRARAEAAAAEAADLVRAAMNDVGAIRFEMAQQLRLALQPRQAFERVQSERREALRARVEHVKNELLSIDAMVNDGGVPPGVTSVR